MDFKAAATKKGGPKKDRSPKKIAVRPAPVRKENKAVLSDCVIFQSETDVKSNFPDERCFRAFCKQRDLFHSVRQNWLNDKQKTAEGPFGNKKNAFVEGRNNPSSDADRANLRNISLRTKIQSIFELNSSPTNLEHLSSLLISQCLLDCESRSVEINPAEVENDELRRLYEKNPSKLAQLQNRFRENSVQRDDLEFPKTFIQSTGSATFIQHLTDRCVLELKNIENLIAEHELKSKCDMEKYFKKMIILASLVGYLIFLPYTEVGCLNLDGIDYDDHIDHQVALRAYQTCPLNLEEYLLKSLKEGRLIFTLPWIVRLLKQGDVIVPHISSYKAIFTYLYHINQEIQFPAAAQYSEPKSPVKTEQDITAISKISKPSRDFIMKVSDSLFSQFPFKPEDSVDPKKVIQCKSISLSDSKENRDDGFSCIFDYNSSIADSLSKIFFGRNSKAHVGTFGATKPNDPQLQKQNESTRRHIKPTTVEYFSKEVKLNLKLEETFFNMHPVSVRKTVEFIAERMASNYVKKIRETYYAVERKELFQNNIFGQQAAIKCRSKLLAIMKDKDLPKVSEAVSIILNESLSAGAENACKSVAKRKCVEIVSNWIDTHINSDLFPSSPTKKHKQPVMVNSNHNDSHEELEDYKQLGLLQRTLQKLHLHRKIEHTDFDALITDNTLYRTSLLLKMILELIYAVIAFDPEAMTKSRMKTIRRALKKSWTPGTKIFCSKFIMVMSQSTCKDESWKKLEEFFELIGDAGFIDESTFESECMKFLRQDWDEDIIHRIASAILTIQKKLRKSGESELLDWIQWYCSDRPDEL